MVNVVLIIIAIVMVALLVLANLYILVYFQSEEDKTTAWFPKVVLIFSLTLTQTSILMLPMDVAHSIHNGAIPMSTLWYVVYITMAVLIIAIIPWTIFYYEAGDPDTSNTKQIREAFKWSFGCLIIFSLLTAILYITLGVAQVPVTKLYSSFVPWTNSTCLDCSRQTNVIITYRVSLALYIISMVAFVGMFLFVVFGGIGLAALPIDMLHNWHNRPKRINAKMYADRKVEMGKRASSLIEMGQKLKEKFKKSGGVPGSRREKQAFRKFRNEVYLLEESHEALEKAYNKGIGPQLLTLIWGWIEFILGLVGIVLSILWLTQIIVYIVLGAGSFLNGFFITLDSAFGLFGTIAFGIFAFYLLWCVIKGNFKMGIRIPLIFDLHPMKMGDTTMNSFLVNTLTVMLASFAVVDLCSEAFSLYDRFTGINGIFNVAVKHLEFFKYFWQYYYWGLYAFCFLTCVVLAMFPGKRKQEELP